MPKGGGTVRGERVERDPLVSRLKKEGDATPMKQGGDRKSGRIEAEANFILGVVAQTPDIILVELQDKLQGGGIRAGVGTLWRFFDWRRITWVVLTRKEALSCLYPSRPLENDDLHGWFADRRPRGIFCT